MDIGTYVRRAMRAMKFDPGIPADVVKFAKRIRVTEGAVRHYLENRNDASVKTLRRIAAESGEEYSVSADTRQ